RTALSGNSAKSVRSHNSLQPCRWRQGCSYIVDTIFSVSSVFRLADQLGHRSHRAVDTPAAWLEQHHGNKAQNGRGEHHAVKAEGKLGHAFMKQGSMIGPMPWELKGP